MIEKVQCNRHMIGVVYKSTPWRQPASFLASPIFSAWFANRDLDHIRHLTSVVTYLTLSGEVRLRLEQRK
jgi:hypothetical protein